MRWTNADKLPDDVLAAMRDVLAEAMREAARKQDPGDGSMIMLNARTTLGLGMWHGGWELQSSLVEDERMNDAPFVIVHAYRGGTLTRGSVADDVVRTADDRRFLAQLRLDAMIKRRDELSAAIDRLAAELKAGA